MRKLSDKAQRPLGQPMFKILEAAQKLERSGKDILHFELGEPDFDTPKNIIKAACDALNNGYTHYASSAGLRELREAIVEDTLNSRQFSPDLDQILITPGANAIIYLTIASLVNPGYEVIVPDPGFPTYFSSIELSGAKAISVPLKKENNFQLDPDDLLRSISSKTRLIIIKSPSNPTGSCMTPEQIFKVSEIAKDHDIFLLSDEVYSRLIFEGIEFSSPGSFDGCKERTIILNGFSKAFAMTGWRLGVAIGPTEVISKMNLMLNTIVSCVPPFIQVAGIEALEGDQSELISMKETYYNRKKIIVSGLNSIKGIDCLDPTGAMYVFPDIRGTGMKSEEFADLCLNKAGVALLPGTNFGKYGEGFVRMCYVNTEEKIIEAIERIRTVLE
jgi:aspartate/methionine/tyrosine aminotransferase